MKIVGKVSGPMKKLGKIALEDCFRMSMPLGSWAAYSASVAIILGGSSGTTGLTMQRPCRNARLTTALAASW